MKVLYIFIIIQIQIVYKAESLSIKKCEELEKLNVHPILNQICNSECQGTDEKEFCHFYSNPTKMIILNRKKRSGIEDNIIPVAKIFVDSLGKYIKIFKILKSSLIHILYYIIILFFIIVNTIKPSFGTQGFILDALKPFLVSVGTGFVKEFVKFVKNIMDQG